MPATTSLIADYLHSQILNWTLCNGFCDNFDLWENLYQRNCLILIPLLYFMLYSNYFSRIWIFFSSSSALLNLILTFYLNYPTFFSATAIQTTSPITSPTCCHVEFPAKFRPWISVEVQLLRIFVDVELLRSTTSPKCCLVEFRTKFSLRIFIEVQLLQQWNSDLCNSS